MTAEKDPNERKGDKPIPPRDPNKPHAREHGGRGYAKCYLSARPKRIAPGQSGEVMIVMALVANGVIEPSSPFSVEYVGRQGDLQLGPWLRSKPQPGTLSPHYVEREVYEDTITVLIPVQVAADAPHGKAVVQVGLTAMIHNGDNGKEIGEQRDVVSGAVVVGPPIPAPVSRRAPAERLVPVAAARPPTEELAEPELGGGGAAPAAVSWWPGGIALAAAAALVWLRGRRR